MVANKVPNLTVNVLDWSQKKLREISLDSSIFQQEVKLHVISDIVRWQQARKRQGSHCVKTRGEVRGGGKKPFRQKGTGRARQGSSRSPLLRSGGVAHGPKPRDYSTKLNSKVRKQGIKMALSHVFSEGNLVVVSDMNSSTGKTKDLFSQVKKFSNKALLLDEKKNDLFDRACKNLSSYHLLEINGLNVYDLLKYDHVICTEGAIRKIHEKYGESSHAH